MQETLERLIEKAQICFDSGEFEKAIEFANRALASNQDSVSALQIIGSSLYKQEKIDEAYNLLISAVNVGTVAHQAYRILGEISMRRCDYHESAKYFLKAYELDKKSIEHLNNAGLAFLRAKEYDLSQNIFLRIIESEPSYCHAYINLASVFAEQNRYAIALGIYGELKNIHTCNHADVDWNISLIRLKLFEFEEGWRLYKSRYDKNHSKKLPLPDTKKPMAGTIDECLLKNIFIYSEQGFGDTIMCLRYLVPLCDVAKSIFLKTKEQLFPLIPLLHLSKPINLLSSSDPIDENSFDVHIPMMDLPSIYKTTDKNIILSEKYIHPPNKTDKKQGRVGIAYETKSAEKNCFYKNKNIGTEELCRILELDFEFLLLSPDSAFSHQKLIKEPIYDFGDTVRLISQCDFVISIDTSLAHLAGAMGVTCYMLTAFYCDWRWGLDGNQSYWYKSIKLFRQKKPSGWDEVVDEIILEIKREQQCHRLR